MFRKQITRPGEAAVRDAGIPSELLRTSLWLEGVAAPEVAESCPDPITLAVGLTEFVLLEGVSTREADALLRLAATLRRPEAGRIRHWGRDLLALSRRALYPWRMRMAFVSPFQSLLPRLSVLENVTLSQTLNTSRSAGEVTARHRGLLEQLDLTAYLSDYPGDLTLRQYHLALWARELIKEPRLILGVLPGQLEQCDAPAVVDRLFPLLAAYREQRRGAVLLAGPALDFCYGVADRRLDCRDGRWREELLPGRNSRSLLGYLDLM